MMICFNATVETRDQLDQLVASGAYRDYGEAIAAAVRNQVLLEKEVALRGPIVIGETPIAPAAPVSPLGPVHAPPAPPDTKVLPSPKKATPPLAPNPAPKTAPKVAALPKTAPRKPLAPTTSDTASAALPKTAPRTGTPAVPAMFLLEGLPEADACQFGVLPPDVWVPGQAVPLERWILGQQNRLFPAKVNARGLIRLFAGAEKGLPLAKTAELVAAAAAALGDYLVALDAKRDTGRDDVFATAFPTTGDGEDKARTRYANQFVTYANGRGELSGLMSDLRLISVVHNKKERWIVPTKVAWVFAWMKNPVLDGEDIPTEKFSSEEREFLVRHIATAVPAEAFAYRAILAAVGAGHNTPETLDAALKAHVSADRVGDLSASFLSSQRSGAVSRMSDLNLIGRQREGTRVTYAINDDGRAFLELCTAPRSKLVPNP
ncbi:MAG: hypothetical protein FJ304_17810 [Planctomycetes bacterium]|nr:hypothetical protein [Planctomycetota bacterium]